MINEQHEERESEENTDHEQFSINQNTSQFSPENSIASTTAREGTVSDSKNQSVEDSYVLRGTQNILDSISTNSDVTEIRNIVQTIAETVFYRADNNYADQLANRSSNTLGMRVKDSLILKVQQTNCRKEIPYDELKASLACRLIVDDDLQIRFLPRIESLPLSSHSENLSTKQKKSVSLAEEVRVFSQVENEFFIENEVDFFNESIDTQEVDRRADELRSTENDDKMYDLTSKQSSSSPVQSENFFFGEVHTLGSTKLCNQDQKGQMSETMSRDLQKPNLRTSLENAEKFDGLGKNPTNSANADLILDENARRQTSGHSARDIALGLRNSSIGPSANGNQITVSLLDTGAHHSSESNMMGENLVSKKERTEEEATIEVSEDLNERVTHKLKDRFENVQTKLSDHENAAIDKLSEVVNRNGEESARSVEEVMEPGGPTAVSCRKKTLTSNVDIESEFKGEHSSEQSTGKSESEGSRMLDNFYKDVERSNAIHVLNAKEYVSPEEDTRSKRSPENTTNTSKTFKIADKTASQNSSKEKKRTQRVEKMIEKTTGSDGKNEDQQHRNLQSTESFRNSEHLSLTTITFVETDANNFFPAQPAEESNNEGKIPEKGTLNDGFIAEKSRNDENTFTPEARLNFKRSPDVDQKINDSELSEAKEWPESLSRSERVDDAGEVADMKIESFTENGDTDAQKLFEKRFVAVQKQRSVNKNEKKIPEFQDTRSNESGIRMQTNQEGRIINEENYNDTHLESEFNNTIAVDENQSTEKSISPSNEGPDQLSRGKEIDDERIEAIESQEIVKSSEKTSPIFLRIIRPKNCLREKIAPEEALVDKDTAIEKKYRKSSAINDQHLAGFSSLRGSLEIDLEDAAAILLEYGESEADKVERKDSGTLPEIESQQLGELTLSDENLKRESRLINPFSSEKTSSKVSLKANKLSKKLSRTDDGTDQQSTNDPSSEVTSSKVYRKASKSSGKLSRTDISELIIPGRNNLRLAPETSPVSSTNRNVPTNESDTKTIEREFERISRSSRDFGVKPLQTEKGKTSPRMNKSFAKLLQKISLKNSRRSKVFSNDDVLPEREDLIDESKTDEESSKSTSFVLKESSKEMERREESIPRKSRSIESQEVSEFDSKTGADKTTTQRDKEKQSLFSNIKSMFKSSNKSDSQRSSATSSEDPENGDIIEESLHSLREINDLSASASEIEADREQSIHFTRESVDIPMIQSMKSLQDNRNRSENRRKTGHRLLDGEDTPFVTENLVTKSYPVASRSDFIWRKNEDEVEEVGADSKSHSSAESEAGSNLQNSLTDAEQLAEEESTMISSWRNKFKKKDNSEGNTKKFTLSFSRIFSNSSRKKKVVKESRAAANSQTNLEDHFEITRIPLQSSYSNSSTKGSESKVTEQKPDVTAEDNREEIVAIESLDSMDDSGNQIPSKKSIEKGSLKILEPECATDDSNERLLRPEQSGTFIYSAPIVESRFSSENELEKKDSSNNVEDMKKPAEKIYAAKGTIVSYAPMVESAKYMPADELDNKSNEDDDQPEDRQKGSSGGGFAAIRKLFSRASIRSRQDRSVEDHPVPHADDQAKQQSEKSGKYSGTKQHQDEDHFVDQSNEKLKQESIILAKASPDESIMTDDEHGIKDPKTSNEIRKHLSKSKVSDVEDPIVYNEILLVNNVGIICRNESANVQSHESSLDDRAQGSIPTSSKSNEVDVTGNKVEPNPGGLEPTETVARVVVEEIVILPASQTDLNNAISEVEGNSNQSSNHTKKSSLLSMAKSYIKEHTGIERKNMEDAKRRVDERSHDQHSLTLPIEDSKKISKQRSVAKTESVLSRGLKKIFKKRSSVVGSIASTNCVENPANDLSQSRVRTVSRTSMNESIDFMVETASHDSRKTESKETSDDVKFAVYNASSKSEFLADWDRRFSQRLEDKNVRDRLDNIQTSESASTVSSLLNTANKSVETLTKAESQYDKRSSIKYKSMDEDTQIELPAALAISETHTAVSFPAQINPETEIRVSQKENVAQNQSRSKPASKDFRLNPNFASRRSTVVMMATPVPPRKESGTEVPTNSNRSRDVSSNLPTAFYYLLGPTLDEALVDVRVVFQNLIDKITGRGR